MTIMENGYTRFFQRNPMPEVESRKLFKHMKLVGFKRCNTIVRQGDFDSNFYVID